MRITFVAVVYNNFKDTLDFLESIASLKCQNEFCCVIVDNSDLESISSDLLRLEYRFKFLSILKSSTNLGYFGAFNYFFESYYVDNDDIVILCNNDLVFDKDFLLCLDEKIYSDDVFVVCPDVITLDGVHQNPHVLTPLSRFQRFKLDLYFSNYYFAIFLQAIKSLLYKVKPIDSRVSSGSPGYLHMGIGACYILLPSFLMRFRKLIYPHFLYGEEAYLSRQVHDAGGQLFYDPKLKVHHKESATLSKIPKRNSYEFAKTGYGNYRKFY